ncbi:MAG: hypothetical protein WCX46_01460 [Candidatus Paceibacterota bacterium]
MKKGTILSLAQLVKKYKKINFIPSKELIKALELDLESSLNQPGRIKVGFVNENLMKKEFNQDTSSILLILKVNKHNLPLEIINISVDLQGRFMCGMHSSLDVESSLSLKKWEDSKIFLSVIDDIKCFLINKNSIISLDRYVNSRDIPYIRMIIKSGLINIIENSSIEGVVIPN